MTSRAVVDPGVVEAIGFQGLAFTHKSLASPLYEALVAATLADIERGGPCAEVLARMPAGLVPVADAVALRYLGAVHRLVLEGDAPALARWYATAGGAFDPATDGEAAGADFVAANAEHRDRLIVGLDQGVQTNEVARCATLAVGFTALLREYGLPLRLFEIGASAGLNLRWDRWRYQSDDTSWGDDGAPLQFITNYRVPKPDVSAPLGPSDAVAERRGCDRSPIDPTTDAGRLLLRSFVWPDQAERHSRLDAALAIAAAVPATVDQSDAAAWVHERLSVPAVGTTTAVYHSVVWQYMPPSTHEGVLAAFAEAGAAATLEAPLAWLRFEPGADPAAAAELRLRTWPGGSDRLLALSGFHGYPVWRADPTTG